MRIHHLTMLLLLLFAALSASFSFNPTSLIDRSSVSLIPFVTSFFSAPPTASYEPPAIVEELPEAILLYDPPAERTWSGTTTIHSIPAPTPTIVYKPALASPVTSFSPVCKELPPHTLDRQSFISTIYAVFAFAFVIYILWLFCFPCRKQRKSKGTQIYTRSKATRTVVIYDNENHIQEGFQNGPRTNTTNGRNAHANINDYPKPTINITCNGDHYELHRRLARFESEKQQEYHTRRCLARDGNDIDAEDLSNEVLVRILRDERAKHAQEIELLEAENASLRHRTEITATPSNPIQENGKSQEKLKEEIEQSFKREIKQIKDQHATESNAFRKNIKDLGSALSLSRGANSAQGVNSTRFQEVFTALQQEITKVIVALLWINQDCQYQLVPRLKNLLPNLPLEQFATAPCNSNAQFPLFSWVLHNTLPNHTFSCPCGGAPGISPDHLREQLSSIHPGQTNIMPDYGLSTGLGLNNNPPQTMYGSTGYAAPTNQPQAYLGNGMSQGMFPPAQSFPGPAVPQITITSPSQQNPTLPTTTQVPFPALNPLPQTTTTTHVSFPTLNALPQTTTSTHIPFPPLTPLPQTKPSTQISFQTLTPLPQPPTTTRPTPPPITGLDKLTDDSNSNSTDPTADPKPLKRARPDGEEENSKDDLTLFRRYRQRF